MEKITKEFYIYNFDELNEDVKNTLIEKERERECEMYCDTFLEEDMQEKAEELVNKYFGITSNDIKTYYDLSYCQGSGSMIEFDVSIEDLNNKYKVFSEEEMRFIQDKSIVSNAYVRHNGSHYEHEYSFDINCSYYGVDYDYEEIEEDYDISKSDFDTIETRLDNLLTYDNKHYTNNVFVKDIISMNKELKEYGYDCIEYFNDCDKEEIINYLDDYKYLESGEVYE